MQDIKYYTIMQIKFVKKCAYCCFGVKNNKYIKPCFVSGAFLNYNYASELQC